MGKTFKIRLVDQYYTLKTLLHSLYNRSPNESWLAANLQKDPIVLIPGLMQKWNIFRDIATLLVKDGHPVFIVKNINRNLIPIKYAAEQVKKVIDGNTLKNVIIIGHSKGGLIGKYLLCYLNTDNKVKKLITIATPFKGSLHAKNFSLAIYDELIPGAKILTELGAHSEINNSITNIYSKLDGLIIPSESCVLEHAKNIQLRCAGHHRLMFQQETCQLIRNEVQQLGDS